MIRRLLAAVIPLVLLLACRGTPAPVSPSRPTQASPSSSAVQSLQRRLSELLANPAVAAGTWGVDVRSLVTDQTLFELNAHRLLTPASTMKLITLAVAADRLGWDYTYETQLLARGAISSGSLDGDLVILGSGDPALDDWD